MAGVLRAHGLAQTISWWFTGYATLRTLPYSKYYGHSTQIVNYYGDSQFLHRSIFSTAGSFGKGQVTN